MPTRQDQLHSHQFAIQRLVAALVMRETDPPQAPFRGAATAAAAGVLVAALALAATAVYGLLVPGGGTEWRTGGSVIVERESGARFVYRDDHLHPVPNYASALLIIGGAGPGTVLVPRRSLADVPRGVPLGIADAPDSLPGRPDLVGPPWTVCSHRAAPVLYVGPQNTGGGRPLGEGALLARHPGGSLHLVWRGQRIIVREPAVVLPALGWGGEPAVPVAGALLDLLPAGAELARIAIADRGRASARVPGARNGEVFVTSTQSGGRQFAVALRDGLAAITQVQADLLIGDPLTRQAVPRTLAPGEYAALPKVGPLPAGDLPATLPGLARPAGGVCAVVRGVDTVEVRVDVVSGSAVPGSVVMPPGRGAVVAAEGVLSLVTDLGRRYELAGPEVLPMLGLGGVPAVELPPAMVALIPPGPTLDPAAAAAPLTHPPARPPPA